MKGVDRHWVNVVRSIASSSGLIDTPKRNGTISGLKRHNTDKNEIAEKD